MIRSETCVCGAKMHLDMPSNNPLVFVDSLYMEFVKWRKEHRCMVVFPETEAFVDNFPVEEMEMWKTQTAAVMEAKE